MPDLACLTKRENQVFDLMATGLPNVMIGYNLGIKPGTVKIHMHQIMLKLGVHNRTAAAYKGGKMKEQENACDRRTVHTAD